MLKLRHILVLLPRPLGLRLRWSLVSLHSHRRRGGELCALDGRRNQADAHAEFTA